MVAWLSHFSSSPRIFPLLYFSSANVVKINKATIAISPQAPKYRSQRKKKQTIVQWTKWPATANESPLRLLRLRLLPHQLMKKLLWSQQREKIRTRAAAAAAVAPNFSCCFRFLLQLSSAQLKSTTTNS